MGNLIVGEVSLKLIEALHIRSSPGRKTSRRQRCWSVRLGRSWLGRWCSRLTSLRSDL